MIPQEKVDAVLQYVRDKCKQFGVTLTLDDKNMYLGNETEGEARAYFSTDVEPELAASIVGDNTIWVVNLLHEVSHIDQWIEWQNTPPPFKRLTLWDKCLIGGEDVVDIADAWIRKKIELTPTEAEGTFKAIAWLEHDAECRTLEYVAHFDLSEIDIVKYQYEAALYVDTYFISWKLRKWLPANRQPHTIPEMVEERKLIDGGIQHNQEEILELFKKYYPGLFTESLN